MNPAPLKFTPLLLAAALLAAACSPAPDIHNWSDPGPGGHQPRPVPALETLPRAGTGAPAQSAPPGAAEIYTALALARQKRLADLAAYTEAGDFPTNTLIAAATPCFMGANGVYCALGYLMVQDGRQATVDAIVAADNNIRLADHPQNPASEWILRSGLTFEECALIQPSYEHMYPPEEVPLPRRPQLTIGRELTQERLRAVVRKLRQDTPQSLRIATQRATEAAPGQGFTFADGLLPLLVNNPGATPLLVRVTAPDAAPATWYRLDPGCACSVSGAGLVEWRPQPLAP